MQYLGTAIQAYGSTSQGIDQSNALKYNASVMNTEARIASTQGTQAEADLRRRNASIAGDEVAAVGQAGGGYGGSVGRSLNQSAINMEMDALNTRYKSQLQAYAYRTQASNLNFEASTTRRAGFLRAGAAALTGAAQGYTTQNNQDLSAGFRGLG